jgi:large subunit ribosomal protein L21
MYAIINIAGQQFKVEKDQQVIVHRLVGEEGKTLEFNDIVMAEDNGKVKIGTPSLKGASVKAKIIGHVRGDKVIIFKKKRRKGYQKQSGHRQDLTRIQIESISGI